MKFIKSEGPRFLRSLAAFVEESPELVARARDIRQSLAHVRREPGCGTLCGTRCVRELVEVSRAPFNVSGIDPRRASVAISGICDLSDEWRPRPITAAPETNF
jgi:hypothetical protein